VKTINAKQLRASLPEIVEQVRRGQEFLVVYRSRPAFRLVPTRPGSALPPLEEDPIFEAGAIGSTRERTRNEDIDDVVYGARRR